MRRGLDSSPRLRGYGVASGRGPVPELQARPCRRRPGGIPSPRERGRAARAARTLGRDRFGTFGLSLGSLGRRKGQRPGVRYAWAHIFYALSNEVLGCKRQVWREARRGGWGEGRVGRGGGGGGRRDPGRRGGRRMEPMGAVR